MAKQTEYISNVKDDNLQMNVRKQIAKDLKEHNGKKVLITIKRVGAQRSDRQNRYYWGCVVLSQIDCFKERWGEIWDKDEVHDWNKCNVFSSDFVDEDTGEIIKRPGSSRTKTKTEFEERMEKLRQFFELNFDWRIQLPNEQLDIEI